MFIWDFDLQTVLSVALLLPFSGAIFVLLLSYLQRHQQRADAQAALLEPLLAQAPIGFLLFDDRKKLLNCNSTARTLLLMPAESLALPNRHWATLLQQDLQTGGRYRTVEIAETQDSQDHPARVVRWWINHNELLTLVLLMDMTTELQAEQAASRLLSDLSHELRTPLATQLTHLEVLSLPDIAEEVRQQSLSFMKDETQRLVRMSNRTLELGRLQSGAPAEPKAVDLRPLVQRVVAQMQVEAAAQAVQIALDLEELLPPIVGDSDQLQQVFLNLLDNALKYGEQKSRVIVTIQRCTTNQEPLHIRRAGSNQTTGSGLGLAMVREILHKHNSQLEIISQTTGDERGTTVTFLLPVMIEDDRGQVANA